MKNALYPKDAIELLTGLMSGSTSNARQLAAGGYPELALVYDAIDGNQEIISLLMDRRMHALSAFLSNILNQDKKAITFLLKTAPVWAATAKVIAKDEQAKSWLNGNNLEHYVALAEAIRKKLNEGSPFEFLYKGPFS